AGRNLEQLAGPHSDRSERRLLQTGWALAAGDPTDLATARGLGGRVAAAQPVRAPDRGCSGTPDRATTPGERLDPAAQASGARATAAAVLRPAALVVPGPTGAREYL